MALLKRVLRALPLLAVLPAPGAPRRLRACPHRPRSQAGPSQPGQARPVSQRPPAPPPPPPSSSPTGTAATSSRSICPRSSRPWPAIPTTKSSWSITAPPTAAPSSSAPHFPQVKLRGASRQPRFRRRLQCRLPRRQEPTSSSCSTATCAWTPDFLAPLLEGFTDPDGLRRLLPDLLQRPEQAPRGDRPDAGLVAGWRPARAPSHRPRRRPISSPASIGGGGSCAFDRDKFLELGGFDELLAPFYLEDTDLGYMAWKRGWKVLYQPRSVVYHEHRGTIGKRFREDQIQAVLKKNFLLFCWKNIHEWPRLWRHFFFAWAGAMLAVLFGDIPLRPNLHGPLARLPPASAGHALPLARPHAGAHHRHRSLPAPPGRLLPRPLPRHGTRARRTRACCSFRPTRSARRCTAAASSCTRPCANWRG